MLRRPASLFATLFLLAIAGFVLAPLASLLHIAWKGDAEIWPHLISYVLPTALLDTALLLAGVAALAAIAGTGTAWLVTAYQFPGRDTLAWLLPLPLAIPTYIVAYVYVDVLDAIGPVQNALRAMTGWRSAADYWFPNVRSLPGAIFVIGIVLYPYVYLAARAMFQTQSASMIEVARTLGATRFMLARHVALPLARPALAVGLSLVLLETLNDIGASEYLGVQTLTLSIFTTWLNRGSLPGAAQIACVMLRRRDRADGARTLRPPSSPLRLVAAPAARAAADAAERRRRAVLASRPARLPVALGFLVPVIYLIHEVIARGLLVGFDTSLIRHTITTVTLSAIATAICVGLGLAAAIAVRMVRGKLASVCLVIAGLGYAIPGTVLALGLLSPLVGIDEGINAVTRTVAAAGVGLVVAGSGAALVIAYVLALSRHRHRLGAGRALAHLHAYGRCRAHARHEALRRRAGDPSAAGAARARRRGLARVRRLPEGIAGDAAAAAAQCRDAADLHLSVRHARQFRGRRARRVADRRGRHLAGHPHDALCGHRAGAGNILAVELAFNPDSPFSRAA